MRGVYRATYPVRELGIEAGDVVIWDARDPEHTVTVVRLCGRVPPSEIRDHLPRFTRLPPGPDSDLSYDPELHSSPGAPAPHLRVMG